MAKKAKKTVEVLAEVEVYGGQHRAQLIRESDPDTGGVVTHARIVNGDVLDSWFDRGKIEGPAYNAGRDFRTHYAIAGLGPRFKTGKLELEPGGGGDPSRAGDAIRWTCKSYRELSEYRKRLGSKAYDLLAYVVGEGVSLREYARRKTWGGRPITVDQASGGLVVALDQMVREFGYDREVRQ